MESASPSRRRREASLVVRSGWTTRDQYISRTNGRTPIRGRSTTSAIQFTGPRLDTSGSTTTETPLEFSRTRRYWATRGQAAAWAAAYSLQFEYGPLSEASIGNVGLNPATNGWVDHVVTPIGAFGLIVAEDALDKYFVKWAESRTTNPVYRFAFRIVFNPARTLSNTATGRWPWHRDDRPLRWRPNEN
jgi:hypothetical protein